MADALGLAGGFVLFSLHFGTDEFHGRESAAQMGSASLPLHQQGWSFRTAGDSIFIKRAVRFFQGEPSVQRNKSFLKMKLLKQGMIDSDCIKSSIAKESSGIDERMLLKKSFRIGMRVLESARGLSSSGESDFLSTMISRWASRKFLL